MKIVLKAMALQNGDIDVANINTANDLKKLQDSADFCRNCRR